MPTPPAPDLRLPAAALAAAASTMRAVAASLATLSPVEWALAEALPGSQTTTAYDAAARAWRFVAEGIAAELEHFADGLDTAAHDFLAVDELLARDAETGNG